MALSDETLEQIVSNLTPEEREHLFSQLGRQIQQDKKEISGGKEPLPSSNKPKRIKDIYGNNNIYNCVYCGSTKLKYHGGAHSIFLYTDFIESYEFNFQ